MFNTNIRTTIKSSQTATSDSSHIHISETDLIPILMVLNPTDGDKVGPWNITVFELTDVAVRPRRFYWILLTWKLQHKNWD